MAKANLDQFKYEIASEIGVKTGADTTSRDNGRVGGEMVRRMIKYAEDNLK
jgi:hypothetical protein